MGDALHALLRAEARRGHSIPVLLSKPIAIAIAIVIAVVIVIAIAVVIAIVIAIAIVVIAIVVIAIVIFVVFVVSFVVVVIIEPCRCSWSNLRLGCHSWVRHFRSIASGL